MLRKKATVKELVAILEKLAEMPGELVAAPEKPAEVPGELVEVPEKLMGIQTQNITVAGLWKKPITMRRLATLTEETAQSLAVRKVETAVQIPVILAKKMQLIKIRRIRILRITQHQNRKRQISHRLNLMEYPEAEMRHQ